MSLNNNDTTKVHKFLRHQKTRSICVVKNVETPKRRNQGPRTCLQSLHHNFAFAPHFSLTSLDHFGYCDCNPISQTISTQLTKSSDMTRAPHLGMISSLRGESYNNSRLKRVFTVSLIIFNGEYLTVGNDQYLVVDIDH